MKPRVLLAAVAVVAALAGSAAAQQPDYQAAAVHYKAAETAMAKGDFANAALEYGIAFDITKDPILYFKIGQANERAGKCPVALTYYNRYLKEGNPSEEYQRVTRERIEACGKPSGTVGDPPVGDPPVGDPPVGDPPVGDPPVGDGRLDPDGNLDGPDGGGLGAGDGGPSFTDEPGSWKRTGAWIATGLTIGLAAAGVVLAMSAEGAEQDMKALIDFRNAGRPVRFDEVSGQYQSLEDDGKRFDTLATVAFASAGATAAIAVTLFIVGRRRGGDRPPPVARLRPAIDRHGGGVVVGWEF
jgi:hypothetical protein